MNKSDEKKRIVYGGLAFSFFAAAAVLLLFLRGRTDPVFAEFSAADALDGQADCYLNTLDVLDRYAEQTTGKAPSELLLVRYYDRDETEVLLSLMVEPDEPLYAMLSPYFAEGDAEHAMATISGYFFCEPLKTNNKSAVPAFSEEAAAYAAWQEEALTYANPVVLRYAGDREEAYAAAKRAQNRGTRIMIIVLGVLATACGLRLLTLRRKNAA